MKEFYKLAEGGRLATKPIAFVIHNGKNVGAVECVAIMNSQRNVNDMLSKKIAEKDAIIKDLKKTIKVLESAMKLDELLDDLE